MFEIVSNQMTRTKEEYPGDIEKKTREIVADTGKCYVSDEPGWHQINTIEAGCQIDISIVSNRQ
jgi:hypothetical protein